MADPAETHSEWFTATDPDVLLNIVRPYAPWFTHPDPATPATMRRLRLYGCACARMVWRWLSTDLCNAVRLSECYADGRASRADVDAACVRLILGPVSFQQHAICAAGWASAGFYDRHPDPSIPHDDLWNPWEAARSAAKALAARTAGKAPPGSPVAVEWQATWNAAFHAARAHQAELVRDIFPPPGIADARRCDPAWLTSTVLTLARQADDTGEYGLLPILADALQDASCDNELILGRCRSESGIHSRGNWVVDLLLGRE